MDFLQQTTPVVILVLVLCLTVGLLVARTLFGRQDKKQKK